MIPTTSEAEKISKKEEEKHDKKIEKEVAKIDKK